MAEDAQGEGPAQLEVGAQWEDLPTELLLKISVSYDGGWKGLLGVCKAWKSSLESIPASLYVVQTPMPPSLPERFLSLTSLDLRSSTPLWVTPRDLQALGALPLTTLVLKLPATNITHTLVMELRALNLTHLALEIPGDPLSAFSKAQLLPLAGLPIVRLDLKNTLVSSGSMLAIRETLLLTELDIACTVVSFGVNNAIIRRATYRRPGVRPFVFRLFNAT